MATVLLPINVNLQHYANRIQNISVLCQLSNIYLYLMQHSNVETQLVLPPSATPIQAVVSHLAKHESNQIFDTQCMCSHYLCCSVLTYLWLTLCSRVLCSDDPRTYSAMLTPRVLVSEGCDIRSMPLPPGKLPGLRTEVEAGHFIQTALYIECNIKIYASQFKYHGFPHIFHDFP